MIACDQDDICVETLTPKLIIRFYDSNNITNFKEVPSLNVWVDGKDTIINNQTLDSIAIPLDINNPQTVYNFRSENSVDQLTVTYNVNEVYVSRSCGFIANYSELDANASNAWIDEVLTIQTTIENENAAHIQIRH